MAGGRIPNRKPGLDTFAAEAAFRGAEALLCEFRLIAAKIIMGFLSLSLPLSLGTLYCHKKKNLGNATKIHSVKKGSPLRLSSASPMVVRFLCQQTQTYPVSEPIFMKARAYQSLSSLPTPSLPGCVKNLLAFERPGTSRVECGLCYGLNCVPSKFSC